MPARSRASAGSVSCSLIFARSLIKLPRHASRDDHGRGGRALGHGPRKSKFWSRPDQFDAACGGERRAAPGGRGRCPCRRDGRRRPRRTPSRGLHARRDPVGPAGVALGEHQPVGVGRGASADRACERTRSGRRVSTPIAFRPSPWTGFHRGVVWTGVPAGSGARGGAAGMWLNMASCEFERFEALDRLAFELGGVAKDHVGAIADLHALRPAGVDRQARRREERGRRASPSGDRSPGARGWAGAAGAFRDQSFEHQLVGRSKAADLVAEPFRAGRRARGRCRKYRWWCRGRGPRRSPESARRARGACGAAAASAAAASRTSTIDHPPQADGLDERWRMRGRVRSRRREAPATPLNSRIRPPSPIPGDYGHRGINKCLAKSAKGEIFSTDRQQTAGRLYWTALDLVAVAFEHARAPNRCPRDGRRRPRSGPTRAWPCAARSSLAPIGVAAIDQRLLSSGEAARSWLKLRAIALTSPRDQAASIPPNRHVRGVLDRAFEQRALGGFGSVSKKPSCSTLVSSSPIGFPAA